jgi:hypothetical protein
VWRAIVFAGRSGDMLAKRLPGNVNRRAAPPVIF